jgi:hypothetical protein
MPCISLLKKLGAIEGSMVLGMKFMGFGEPRDWAPSGSGDGMPALFIWGVPRFICSEGFGEAPVLPP